MVKQVEELMKKDIDTRDATAKKPSSEDVNASVMQNISHESEADLLNNTVQLKNSCKENADLTVGNVSEKDIVWKLEEDSSESCSGAKKAKVDKLNWTYASWTNDHILNWFCFGIIFQLSKKINHFCKSSHGYMARSLFLKMFILKIV